MTWAAWVARSLFLNSCSAVSSGASCFGDCCTGSFDFSSAFDRACCAANPVWENHRAVVDVGPAGTALDVNGGAVCRKIEREKAGRGCPRPDDACHKLREFCNGDGSVRPACGRQRATKGVATGRAKAGERPESRGCSARRATPDTILTDDALRGECRTSHRRESHGWRFGGGRARARYGGFKFAQRGMKSSSRHFLTHKQEMDGRG